MITGSKAKAQSPAKTLQELRAKMPDTLFVLTRSQIDRKDLELLKCNEQGKLLQAEVSIYKNMNSKSQAIENNYKSLDQEAKLQLSLYQANALAFADSLRHSRRKSIRLGKALKLSLPISILTGLYLGTKF